MPVKVTRKFFYVVEGKEYADQKAANEAAKEANKNEKRMVLTKMIEDASDPTMAALAIMTQFHVYNRNENVRTPGVKYPRKKRGKAYDFQPTITDDP